jgi:acyl carrier protein
VSHARAVRSGEHLATLVGQILLKHAHRKPGSLREEHVLTRDLGFDSLAFLLTVSDLEDRLGWSIRLDEVEDLHAVTFGGVLRLVSDAREADATPA